MQLRSTATVSLCLAILAAVEAGNILLPNDVVVPPIPQNDNGTNINESILIVDDPAGAISPLSPDLEGSEPAPLQIPAAPIEDPESAGQIPTSDSTTVGRSDDSQAPAPAVPVYPEPYGPYYCHVRCLASCIETRLAQSLEKCQQFCPRLEEYTPCAANDTQCWITCGVLASLITQPTPEPTILVNADSDQRSDPDPFLIEIAWSPVPSASVYIVEFYPFNRIEREGENNFYRDITTSLAYTVRKEDECVEYDARVIAVNAYGASEPTYLHIPAPMPIMLSDGHFTLRHMQRNAQDSSMITVTVDYTFPDGWPASDVDIDSIRVTATDCQGPLLQRSFGAITSPNDILIPAYNVVIGKTPTAAIQLSFFDDTLQSNCLFQMRVSSISSRCNTSATIADTPALSPGVDFRINCETVPGACDNDTGTMSEPSPPLPLDPINRDSAVPMMISPPAFLPPGISQSVPDDNITEIEPTEADVPTPPPFPFPMFGGSQNAANAAGAPEIAPVFSVVDAGPDGSNVQTMQVMPDMVVPPNCEMQLLDVQPLLISQLSPSLVDVQIRWLERLPPIFQLPSYFTIRYGPIIRKLVDDIHEPPEIVPGYETILRTGQQLPQGLDRQVTISNLRRNSLLQVQVCAIYDPNSEPMIQWQTVPTYRVDLAVVETFLELEGAVQPSSQPPDMAIASNVARLLSRAHPFGAGPRPIYVEAGVNPKMSSTTCWALFLACITIIFLIAALSFVCLRANCRGRRPVKHVEKPAVFTAPALAAGGGEVVKVPIA